MKEIINIHIGQAGIQMGSAMWELLCAEHSIDISGVSIESINSQGQNRLFFETSEKQFVPRCLLVDLEPSVVDEVRSGPYKNLFSKTSLISGYEDAASIFSRGYFSFGRFFINDIMDKVNREIELSDNPQAFIFTHSSGGGTGSGLFSLMVEEMEDFSKIIKMDVCVYPSFPISPIIVEPYNSVLTSHYTMDNTDISFLMDNEALYNLATRHLDQIQLNYHNINRISGQLMSSITAATRFDGQSTTVTEYLHNLVPYPRIHFPICSLSPLCSPEKQMHYPNTIFTITKDALSHDYQMIRCIPMDGKFMSCCMMYRGDVSPGEVYTSIEKLRCYERMQFVDWSPTGVKITICNRPATIIASSGMGFSTRSLTVLCNNSAIVDALLQNTFRFHILFKKRAFVHWFVGEGMEEEEFKDSLENIACLVKDYEECAYPTKLLQNSTVIEDNDEQKAKESAIRLNDVDPQIYQDDADKAKQNDDEEIDSQSSGEQNPELHENNANFTRNNYNVKLFENYISDEGSKISSFITPDSVMEGDTKQMVDVSNEFDIITPVEQNSRSRSKSEQNIPANHSSNNNNNFQFKTQVYCHLSNKRISKFSKAL